MKFNDKYGFRWEEDEQGNFLGISKDNHRYAIAADKDGGNWTYEICTLRKSLLGTYGYEPQNKPFFTNNILEAVTEVNRRIDYWRRQNLAPKEVVTPAKMRQGK